MRSPRSADFSRWRLCPRRLLRTPVRSPLCDGGVLIGCSISNSDNRTQLRGPWARFPSGSDAGCGSPLHARRPGALPASGHGFPGELQPVCPHASHARVYRGCHRSHRSGARPLLAVPLPFPLTSTQAPTQLSKSASRHSCSAVHGDSHRTCSKPSVVTGLEGQTARMSG